MKKIIIISVTVIVLASAYIVYYKFFAWQSYVNDNYGYKIKYPHGWIIDNKKSLVDGANAIFSIVNIYDASMKNSVSVEVSENDVTLPLQKNAFKTESVKIAGIPSTAYIFKSEYNECGASPTEYCAYFLIPIKHNNFWYTLSAGGKLQGYEGIYKKILSTFRFRK